MVARVRFGRARGNGYLNSDAEGRLFSSTAKNGNFGLSSGFVFSCQLDLAVNAFFGTAGNGWKAKSRTIKASKIRFGWLVAFC
jgi:hypothetical protein